MDPNKELSFCHEKSTNFATELSVFFFLPPSQNKKMLKDFGLVNHRSSRMHPCFSQKHHHMQWTQPARCLTHHSPKPCFSFCASFTRGKKSITPSIFAAQLKASRHQGTCKSLKGPGTCRIWQFLGVHNSARLLEPPVTNNRPPPGRWTFRWLEFCWKVLGPVVYVLFWKK